MASSGSLPAAAEADSKSEVNNVEFFDKLLQVRKILRKKSFSDLSQFFVAYSQGKSRKDYLAQFDVLLSKKDILDSYHPENQSAYDKVVEGIEGQLNETLLMMYKLKVVTWNDVANCMFPNGGAKLKEFYQHFPAVRSTLEKTLQGNSDMFLALNMNTSLQALQDLAKAIPALSNSLAHCMVKLIIPTRPEHKLETAIPQPTKLDLEAIEVLEKILLAKDKLKDKRDSVLLILANDLIRQNKAPIAILKQALNALLESPNKAPTYVAKPDIHPGAMKNAQIALNNTYVKMFEITSWDGYAHFMFSNCGEKLLASNNAFPNLKESTVQKILEEKGNKKRFIALNKGKSLASFDNLIAAIPELKEWAQEAAAAPVAVNAAAPENPAASAKTAAENPAKVTASAAATAETESAGSATAKPPTKPAGGTADPSFWAKGAESNVAVAVAPTPAQPQQTLSLL